MDELFTVGDDYFAADPPCVCERCGQDVKERSAPSSNKERRKERDRRCAVAFHEAGHICVAWALEAELLAVSIKCFGNIAGRAIYGHPEAEGASVDRIISIQAGLIAQRQYDPRSYDGSSHDQHDTRRLLQALCRDGVAAEIVLAECVSRAKKQVTDNWDAISLVAEALIERETITGDQLKALMVEVGINRHNAKEPTRRNAWREAELNAAEFARTIILMKENANGG